MNIRAFTVVIALLLSTGSSAVAGNADHAELQALLDEFLAGASASDAEVHRRFWAEDLVYTSSAGLRFGKAEILAGLAGAEEPEDPVRYSAADVQIRQFDEIALVTFRLLAESGQERPEQFYNTGVFVRRDGRWQAVAWQATRRALDAD